MQPIEHQILLAASGINPDEEGQEKLRGLLSHEFDSQRLIELAVREGLVGFLYKSLKRVGMLCFLGHQHIQRLQSLYYLTVRFNLQLIHDLKAILHQLNQNQIPLVLLQGMPLLQQIYKDIGLRPLTDIDLWVLPENRESVDKTLISLGFERDPIYTNMFKKGSTIIDINCHILWADRIKSRRWILNRSQMEIYQNSRAFDFEGEQALCLSPYDQVLYLSLHALKHSVNRLIWLVDIKSLLIDWKLADWKELLNRSGELGQQNAVKQIVFLLCHLFDFQPPHEIQTSIESRRPSCLEERILGKRLKGNPLPVWAPLLLFSTGNGLLKHIFFIFENLFPRPEILRQVFANSPDLRVWQLYLKRVLQLVGQVKL